jgi:predicted alpha-1,6-mannanase (GH76 family)
MYPWGDLFITTRDYKAYLPAYLFSKFGLSQIEALVSIEMLSKSSLKSLATCLVLATSLHAEGVYSATSATYAQEASTAIQALNSNWYDSHTGLWDGAWWQSANALTTLADFAILQPGAAKALGISNTIRNTFQNAQQRFAGFINPFYDDEGWWALGLIQSYDATGDEEYLEMAADIFNDMQKGGGTPCKGGIFTSKDRNHVNAAANELYLAVAASLANRIPSNRTYSQVATNQWNWFRQSGMINGQSLINDGLDSSCENNGLQTWSVNQGVILGALAELSRGSLSSGALINTARKLAKSAITALSNADGILVEADNCETASNHCGYAKQFKGVFIRNLGYLNQIIGDTEIRAFILKNADSVWSKDRDTDNKMGVAWAGPIVAVNGATQGSALDALVAAIRAA